MQPYWTERFGFREDRPASYLDELTTLFETVLDTGVYRMEKFVTMDPNLVRQFLEDIDDVDNPDIEW